MSIGITADHAALAETVRRWADTEVGAAGRRAGLEDQQQVGADHWAEMVAMGWPVLHAPEPRTYQSLTALPDHPC